MSSYTLNQNKILDMNHMFDVTHQRYGGCSSFNTGEAMTNTMLRFTALGALEKKRESESVCLKKSLQIVCKDLDDKFCHLI